MFASKEVHSFHIIINVHAIHQKLSRSERGNQALITGT